MKTLVYCEHQNGKIKRSSLACIHAAKCLNQTVDLLFVGSDADHAGTHAKTLAGINTIWTAASPNYDHGMAETNAALLAELSPDYSHILSAATTTGKNIFPRLAAILKVHQLSDVTKIIDANTIVRPIYAGNAYETVESFDPIKIITVRSSAFEPAIFADGNATIHALDHQHHDPRVKHIQTISCNTERPALTSAHIIISGGRGFKSKEEFDTLLQPLADALNAAIGASRAAVDLNYASNDLQVGQTGKIVAPHIYIAVGISGAIQHTAGIKDSKIIIAINKDPSASIFDIADIGLIADLKTAVPELLAKIQSAQKLKL